MSLRMIVKRGFALVVGIIFPIMWAMEWVTNERWTASQAWAETVDSWVDAFWREST